MIIYFINLVATVRLWRQRKRTRQLLAAFDDRMLKDIGITRCELQREITKPFWRQ